MTEYTPEHQRRISEAFASLQFAETCLEEATERHKAAKSLLTAAQGDLRRAIEDAEHSAAETFPLWEGTATATATTAESASVPATIEATTEPATRRRGRA